MRLRSLRRGRLRSRLGYWENLDTADFLADVAHGKSVGNGVEIGACSAVPTENNDRAITTVGRGRAAATPPAWCARSCAQWPRTTS